MIIQDTNRLKKYFVDALNAGEKFEEVNPEFNPRAEINNSRISQYFSTPETETEQKIFVQFTVKIKRKNFSSNPQNRIEKYFRKNQSNFSTQNFNRLKISVLVEFKTAQGVCLHKYLYCANDPINKIDPNGKFYYFAMAAATFTIIGVLFNLLGSFLSSYFKKNTNFVVAQVDETAGHWWIEERLIGHTASTDWSLSFEPAPTSDIVSAFISVFYWPSALFIGYPDNTYHNEATHEGSPVIRKRIFSYKKIDNSEVKTNMENFALNKWNNPVNQMFSVVIRNCRDFVKDVLKNCSLFFDD